MGVILDLVGEFISQWLVTLRNRPLDFIALLVAFFGLAGVSIGLLITPDANRVMGAVIGVAALVVLWGIVRMLRRTNSHST